jgi:hypothetical protein
MSPFAPSRHFAARQDFGRFRREADIKWEAGPAGLVENDPTATSASAFDRASLSRHHAMGREGQ